MEVFKMAHTIYPNTVLENKIEDLLTTHVDMNNYLTPDYSLTESAGMKKVIHTYTSTGDVQDLTMGQGNSDDIEVSFTSKEYTVTTTQGRFKYFDEQEMQDPMVVDTGINGLTQRMTNDLTKKAIAEFGKTTNIKYNCTWSYNDVVDAVSMLSGETQSGLFLLINKAQEAAFRKNLKDQLSYVEANVRTGYIGDVCGATVVVSNAVPAGEAYLGDKTAAKCFLKKGIEVEQERDANTRENRVFARKVMLVALVDEGRMVKLTASARG